MATPSSQGDPLDAILHKLHKLNERCNKTLESLSVAPCPPGTEDLRQSAPLPSRKQEAPEAQHPNRAPLLKRATTYPVGHSPDKAQEKATPDHDLESSRWRRKYKKAFVNGPDGPEVLTFFGEDRIETTITDFDLVFVFRNPGHSEEFAKLLKSVADNEEEQKVLDAAVEAVRQEQANAEHTFLKSIIEREERRQAGTGPKIMLRCSSCGIPRSACSVPTTSFRSTMSWQRKSRDLDSCPKCNSNWEEILKKCGKCSRKIDYDKTMCAYCRCSDLKTKTFPIVGKVEDMDHEAIGLFTEELLRDFFSDPRQGDQLHVSNNMTGLQDARRAVIDIFLSFFRAQEEDEYYTYLFKSVDFDEIFLCVKMNEKTAKQHAEQQQFCCMLNTDCMTKPIEDGGMHIKYDNEFQRFLICNDFLTQIAKCFWRFASRMSLVRNPAMIGGPVQYEPGMEKLLLAYPEESTKTKESVLKKADRIRLLYDKVTDVISVEDMVKWNLLSTFYPLHTKEALIGLKNRWARIGLAYKYTQPINDIKDYFGPHIALYFIFLEHMLKYSLILVAMSVGFLVVDFVVEARKHFALEHKSVGAFILRFLGGVAGEPRLRIFWSLFVIIWSQLFQIRLKRKVTTACNLWGLDGDVHSTVKNELNPRFAPFASITESELNENEMVFSVPWEQKQRGRLLSMVATVAFVAFTTFCSLGILKVQSNLYEAGNTTWSSRMSFVLTIEIKILNGVWIAVGQWLVDREFWSERLDYDNAIAYKNFYVQVVTTFVSFYYIAFAMYPFGDKSYSTYGGYEGHPAETPWGYLTFQMIYTFGLYLVFAVYDLLSPLISMWWTRREEKKTLKQMREDHWEYSFIELQSKMAEYDGDLQNDDYMQILLPYGFVLFFGATLPISAALCWIYTSLQLRVDAWKLCHAMRRPYPRETRPGAWVWEDIIDVFMSLVVVTNIGLICFVMKPCREQSATFRWFLFFLMLVATNAFKNIAAELYPTVSSIVQLARRRHEYQREAAQKMFVDQHRADFLNLRASKDIKFDVGVGRLRQSNYKSKNHEVIIDRSLVDKIFQPEMPWISYVPEPEP